MDKYWQTLEELTTELVARIDQVTFEEMEAYMESRNELFSILQRQELTPGDQIRFKSKAEKLLQHREVIEERMHVLKEEATLQIIKMESSKKQKQAYSPDYDHESVFFEKRS